MLKAIGANIPLMQILKKIGFTFKVLHYALGFPPFRTGGLTKFCMDLMIQQCKDGYQVAMMWPGKIDFAGKRNFNKVTLKDRGLTQNIQSFEVINPLPVSYDEGIQEFETYMHDDGREAYDKLLSKYEPDVIHVHTLMGLHLSFLECAKERGIRLVFTAHDFFPICPKVTLFRNGTVCQSAKECADCAECNTTALSVSKIKILQSPLYRALKDSSIVKKLRKRHRDEYLSDSSAICSKGNAKGTFHDYRRLRDYYYSLLKLMDVIHYNSTITKATYEQFFDFHKSVVIGISHADIQDHRKKKEFSKHIRFTYLGAQSSAKGYFLLKQALDKLWHETHDFVLNVHFEPFEPSPYIRSHPRYSTSELEGIMDYTDVLIAPSVWYETFGYTVLEALSYGVPVVISGHVGAKDIVPYGAGVIIDDMDSNKLFIQLRRLMPKHLNLMNEAIIENAHILTVAEMGERIEAMCYRR